MATEPTIRDVLDAIQLFSTNVDKRFDAVEEEIRTVKQNMKILKQEIGEIRSTVATKSDISHLVSKEYLEGRLAHIR